MPELPAEVLQPAASAAYRIWAPIIGAAEAEAECLRRFGLPGRWVSSARAARDLEEDYSITVSHDTLLRRRRDPHTHPLLLHACAEGVFHPDQVPEGAVVLTDVYYLNGSFAAVRHFTPPRRIPLESGQCVRSISTDGAADVARTLVEDGGE